MKLLIFALTLPLAAQTLTLSGPTKVRVGQSLTLTIGFTGGASQVSGFQFDSSAGPWTPLVANKSVTCNPANGRCIIIGDIVGNMNADALVTGNVATATWVVPSVVPTSVSLAAIVATAPDASPATLTPTVALMLTLFGDVNGDRQLTKADIDAAKDQSTGKVACTTGDQNEDGVCNVRDVQLVTNEVRAAGG